MSEATIWMKKKDKSTLLIKTFWNGESWGSGSSK